MHGNQPCARLDEKNTLMLNTTTEQIKHYLLLLLYVINVIIQSLQDTFNKGGIN